MALIAFDAAADKGFAASPVTWSHTCTGSSLILFIGIFAGGDVVTAVTYNSVAATQIAKLNLSGAGELYLYYLLAPSTGSNTVSVTLSSGTAAGTSSSYTSAKQSGVPDASGSKTQSAGPTSIANSITVVGSNAWAVTVGGSGTGITPTAGSNVTSRAGNGMAIGDSNGIASPGSYSQTWNVNGGADSGIIQASFLPVPSSGGNFFAVF